MKFYMPSILCAKTVCTKNGSSTSTDAFVVRLVFFGKDCGVHDTT